MFYYPNNFYNPYPLYRVNPATSYIRILHASPKSPAVDIYINDTLTFKNLTYRGFTEYVEVIPGNYNIKVYATGTTTSPVLNKTLNIPVEKIYTIAAIGLLPNIDLLPVPETKIMEPANKAYIKFTHLSPNAPAVDITLPDGTILFKNIAYKQFTDYIEVPEGTYTLEVRVAGTNTTVLHVPNIKLKPQRFYTVYAIGLVNDSPGLQALIPLDGSSYLDLYKD